MRRENTELLHSARPRGIKIPFALLLFYCLFSLLVSGNLVLRTFWSKYYIKLLELSMYISIKIIPSHFNFYPYLSLEIEIGERCWRKKSFFHVQTAANKPTPFLQAVRRSKGNVGSLSAVLVWTLLWIEGKLEFSLRYKSIQCPGIDYMNLKTFKCAIPGTML